MSHKNAHPISVRMLQCSWCSKIQGPDMKLLRCACKVDLFCNKECQRAAWPSHKSKCKAAQARLAENADEADIMQALRYWCRTHRMSFYELALRDLGLATDPSAGGRDMFAVTVRERVGETRTAHRFEVIDTSPYPAVDMDDELSAEFRRQYKTAHERLAAVPGIPPHGTFIVGTKIEGYHGINIAPMSFELGVELDPVFDHDKTILDINEGR